MDSMTETLQGKRKKAGLSQEDVADMLEVSRQTVSAWEKGTKKIPKQREIQLKILFMTF